MVTTAKAVAPFVIELHLSRGSLRPPSLHSSLNDQQSNGQDAFRLDPMCLQVKPLNTHAEMISRRLHELRLANEALSSPLLL